MHRVPAIFAGAVLGCVLIATPIGLAIDVPRLVTLHFHHAETTGRIIGVIPNSHGLTEIEYWVQGTAYKSKVTGSWVFPSHGEPTRFFYNPDEPTIASAVPAAQILKGQLPPWIAGSILGSIFGICVAWSFTRQYPDRQTSA